MPKTGLAAATLAGTAGAAPPPAPPGILAFGAPGETAGVIVQMDTRGRGQKIIRGNGAGEPVYSRNGKRLAYRYWLNEIWVAAPDGTGARRVVRARGEFGLSRPTWSPDGRRIAYVGPSPVGASDRRAGLWIVEVATRRGRFVAPMWLGADPDWSPDGRWFAYAPGPYSGLWLISSDGKRKRRLSTGATSTPHWSPGGRWIAYESVLDTTASSAVRIIEPATGRMRTLASPAAGPLAWSPDGVWLAYTTTYEETLTYDETFYEIRMRRIRDGARRLVLETRMGDLYGLSWRRP